MGGAQSMPGGFSFGGMGGGGGQDIFAQMMSGMGGGRGRG